MSARLLPVYRYLKWDEGRNCHVPSDVYATSEAIRDGLGIVIYESAIWVREADVSGGVFRPASSENAPMG